MLVNNIWLQFSLEGVTAISQSVSPSIYLPAINPLKGRLARAGTVANHSSRQSTAGQETIGSTHIDIQNRIFKTKSV